MSALAPSFLPVDACLCFDACSWVSPGKGFECLHLFRVGEREEVNDFNTDSVSFACVSPADRQKWMCLQITLGSVYMCVCVCVCVCVCASPEQTLLADCVMHQIWFNPNPISP